jgi:hypothetical protein
LQIARNFAPTAAVAPVGDERDDSICRRHAVFLALTLSFKVNGVQSATIVQIITETP